MRENLQEVLANVARPEHADVLQTIIDFLPSGVTLFDLDLQMIACNERFKRLLDFPEALFAGGLPNMQDLAIFNARRGDYGSGDPEVLAQQVVERARSMQAHVFERIRPDGTVLEIRGTPLPEGRGFVAIYTDITERKQAEQEAKRYATYLDTVLNTLPQGVSVVDENLDLILWNQRFVEVLGLPPDLMRDGVRLADVIRHNARHGEYGAIDPEEKVQQVVELAMRFEPHRMERTRPNGQTIDVEGWPMRIDGKVAGFITTYTDITESKAAAEKNRASESLYRLLTEDAADVLWKTDRDLRFTYISPADERLRGYRADEVIGHHVFEMFTAAGIASVMEAMQHRQAAEQDGTQTGFLTFEAEHRCKDGRLIWGEVLSSPMYDENGTIAGYHGITREITQRKLMQDQIKQLAFYDTLTNLPNRRLLNDRLGQAMATSQRSGCYGALMFLDLDNFKPLNDTHGHVVGDLLLMEAAKRLKSCVREMDTVARFGGDEFVVMMNDLNADRAASAAQTRIVAEKIHRALSEPYRLIIRRAGKADATVDHHCSVSIGVALFIDHEASQDDILKWADMAMYQVKEAGRNGIRFYDRND